MKSLKTRGAALVEYVTLLALIAVVIAVPVFYLGNEVVNLFGSATSGLKYAQFQQAISSAKKDGSGAPAVAVFAAGYSPTSASGSGSGSGSTSTAAVSASNPIGSPTACPPISWQWDPSGGYYVVPGYAAEYPLFAMLYNIETGIFPGSYGGGDLTSKIYPGYILGWDWWGRYEGIHFFYYVWSWTAYFPASSITTPDPSCNVRIYGSYTPPTVYGADQTGWLMGTPNSDTLQITNQPGANGLASDDTITGTSYPEGFIGGPGNDTINGGGGDDTFYFGKTDGHDTYIENPAGVGSSVDFVDAPSTDATATRSGNDLLITLKDTGGSVDIQNWASATWTYQRIPTFTFTDKTMTAQQMRDLMDVGQVASGTVVGTPRNDNYVIPLGIGNVNISETNGTDSITFPGTEASVSAIGNSNRDLILTDSAGDVVTVDQTFTLSPRYTVENYNFSDGSLDLAGMIAKADQNPVAKASGTVYGSQWNDSYTFNPGDNYTIIEANNLSAGDTLTIPATQASVRAVVHTNGDLTLTDSGGDVLTIQGGANTSWERIENYNFSDGSLNFAGIIAKADQDPVTKASGTVYGSDATDSYTFNPGDNYTIIESNGNDTLTIPATEASIHATVQQNGDLTLTDSGGDVLTIHGGANTTWDRIENYNFSDGSLDLLGMIAKADQDPVAKASGIVYGSDTTDSYTFNPGDNYTIIENNGNDTLTIAATEASIHAVVQSNGDIKLTDTGGDVLTIQGGARYNWDQIENYTFSDGSLNFQGLLNKADQDPAAKASGMVYGTNYNDNYTFTSSDPSYSILEINGTDTITFQQAYGSYTYAKSSNGNDLLITDPTSGKTLTVIGFYSGLLGQRIESYIFSDQTVSNTQLQADHP